MNIEVPESARRVFNRLCKGENLILSQNGPDDDPELFQQLEDDAPKCRLFFEILGFNLQKSDNCYYFTVDEEPHANIENKVERMVRLVRLLDFLTTHVEHFSEGQIFSASSITARCNGDSKAERFLAEEAKGGTSNHERVESLLQSLVRSGFLSEYESSRHEYRVLSAINYLFEFADRIVIHKENAPEEADNAKA
jgi:hypothetical protein